MSRVAYLDCVGGLAGDMLLAALVDAGAPFATLAEVPARLGLPGVAVELERVERQGCGAAHVVVHVPERPVVRHWPDVRAVIERSDLPARASERALAVFSALAAAEAGVHGVPVEHVHFHEVGADDALVDVCGAALLLEELDVARVACSPLPVARGLVRAAHGVLPLPAPATARLLVGAPLVGVEGDLELVTPTGAALAAALVEAWGPLPPLTLEAVGVGAGTRELPDRPNVVRAFLGSEVAATSAATVSLLETNLDDLLPELVPDAVERCLEAGALDVWVTPVLMKKGRPGFVFSVLARPEDEQALAAVVLRETTALGVRVSRRPRYELEREQVEVRVEGEVVRVKVGRLDGRVVNVAPEHDDCAAVARRSGRSVKSVWADVLAAASAQ